MALLNAAILMGLAIVVLFPVVYQTPFSLEV